MNEHEEYSRAETPFADELNEKTAACGEVCVWQDEAAPPRSYRIIFREGVRPHVARTKFLGLKRGALVMARLENRLEPGWLSDALIVWPPPGGTNESNPPPPEIERLATDEEQRLFHEIIQREKEACLFCQEQIDTLGLIMNLVRTECFFDGTKMIFYFTAESRVDFRELVKSLVHQYHTRIEMRQIGVRHETQMLGGLGICGRQLCCVSFRGVFDSVSIKMAKAQDLPLNPAKISGACGRLLCCLAYEYEQYREARKGMPKPGRTINMQGLACQVEQIFPLSGKITVVTAEGNRKTLNRAEWQQHLRGGAEEGLPESELGGEGDETPLSPELLRAAEEDEGLTEGRAEKNENAPKDEAKHARRRRHKKMTTPQ